MNTPTRSFEQLTVWQKAHQYVLFVYRISRMFPQEEIFGLTHQIRRAAISITANIVEGYICQSAKDKLGFYNIAQGSLEEIRNFTI